MSLLSKTRSSGRLAQEFGARLLRDKQGGEAYVGLGFKFWKYGAYREYGAGRGYIVKDGIIMKGHSAWRDQKTRDKYRAKGYSEYKIRRTRTIDEHYAIIQRTPLRWLDPPITDNIDKLADISAEFYGDEALKAVLKNFDKITDKFLKMSDDVRDSIQTQKHFDNYEALLVDYNKTDVTSRKKVLYVDDKTGREYICYVDDSKKDSIKEVNLFSDLTRKEDRDDSVQLNIVPANTKLYNNIGWWFDQYQGAPSTGLSLNVPFSERQQTNNPEYTKAQDIISNSYSTKTEAESSGCIEVMISTGQWYHLATYSNHSYNYPAPFSDFNMPCSAYGKFPEMSLSLKDVCENSLGHMYRNLPSYRSTHKFVIRFLDTKVPDVR